MVNSVARRWWISGLKVVDFWCMGGEDGGCEFQGEPQSEFGGEKVVDSGWKTFVLQVQ